MRERHDWPKGLEGLRAGIALQRLEGIIRAEIVQLERDAKSGRFQVPARTPENAKTVVR